MYIDTLIKSRESNVEEKARQALSRIEDLCLNSDEDTMNINNYAYNLCKCIQFIFFLWST